MFEKERNNTLELKKTTAIKNSTGYNKYVRDGENTSIRETENRLIQNSTHWRKRDGKYERDIKEIQRTECDDFLKERTERMSNMQYLKEITVEKFSEFMKSTNFQV